MSLTTTADASAVAAVKTITFDQINEAPAPEIVAGRMADQKAGMP